ncbi:exocyst subunit exo70 family protein A2 [Perilla frutescens var. hirtella]|uniref:Exocyst subunit Exo70 family protein n=1 Tax=Perilla frutescens var. hirtella TaxID=608512 RepID=A0AAD4NXS7_PERFH|nr:exocyst subunit exo70 family protein A2 [Perilla frutescens var. hirtella]KAH6797543.1 exocyst subunit exo70 family protein A2 [Perilla frutescens var. hirtella]KAH6798915.1 exocyst subunit exo70 family protein A2 [Perilla frutescens var. frutescens]
MGGYAVAMETLTERAALMRDSMQKTQLKTHSIRRAHENIDKTLKVAEAILEQFDRSREAEAKILRGPHEDLESYLEAVEQLRSIVQFFTGNKNFKSGIGVVNQANALLGKAILKLEEEFRQLLSAYSKPIEPDRLFDCLPNSMRPSTGSPREGEPTGKKSDNHNKSLEAVVYQLPTLIPPKLLPLLHEIAKQMIQAGHQQQVAILYREARASAVEQTLRKLGVERLGKDEVQKMQWEVLEAKIGNWIHFMRIAIKLLFAGEKKVCDDVFKSYDNLRDQCFAEVTGTSVITLLSFGDAIAKSKRSPEKLFVLLDMYEIMRELQPEMDNIFESKFGGEMREAFTVLTKKLAKTAQDTFADFEEAVEKDCTKTAVLDGTVHPLTSYVINYVKFLFDYHSTLQQLFKEFGEGDSEQRLASITTKIMQALQSNLEGKSKQYKDPALTQLFLMNNIHYIVRSVRRSEAKDLLGDDWVQIHRRVVQQHANQYKRIAWSKILQCLTIQGAQSAVDSNSTAGVSRAMVKDRFKTFNTLFEEIHQRQSQWTVPDSELRESLRLAVAEVLLPAYRSFIRRFGPMIEGGKNPQKYIRYTPEDLERMLAEFFEGKTWNEPKR